MSRSKGARSGDTRHMGIFQPKLAALVSPAGAASQLPPRNAASPTATPVNKGWEPEPRLPTQRRRQPPWRERRPRRP